MITTLQEKSKENVGMEDKRRVRPSKSPLGPKDYAKTREALSGLDNARSSSGTGRPSAPSGSESAAERLIIQRQKAIKTLKKVSNPERSSLSSLQHLQAPISKSNPSKKSPKHLGLNNTDCVPYANSSEFNISDLVADHTIDIKSMTSSGTPYKISFEPSEITGRSTMCISEKDPESKIHMKPPKSVKDILSQSLVDDVRSLSDTLPSCDGLTRTVDNIPDSHADSCRVSFAACVRDDDSELFGESFKPAEMMNSQLCADERAWEQQFADIPNINHKTSDEKHKRLSETMRSDKNFSIGDYFSKHSESIRNIVPNMKSPQKRPPVALHEDSLDSFSGNSPPSKQNYSLDMLTPRVDGKQYSEYVRPSMQPSKNPLLSGEIDRAQRMNMMAIKKALYEINSEDSAIDIRSKLSFAMKDMNINMLEEDVHRMNKPSSLRKGFLAGKDSASLTKDGTEYSSLEDTVNVSKSYLEMTDSSCDSFGSFGKQTQDNNSLRLPAASKLKSRKRSHSSTRLDGGQLSDQEIPIRRSRSPTTHSELSAAAGSRANPSTPTTLKSRLYANSSTRCIDYSMTESDRQFLIDTKSPDCGKYSLPSNGVLAQSASTLSNVPSKMRSNSQCSTSSEFSHRGGKLPLKASNLELLWGCLRLRKSVQKSIQIKNASSKRLIVKAEVSGPGFQLVTSSGESSGLMRLQSQECRTLNLNFCPTVIGLAAGHLVFSSPYENVSGDSTLVIKLYGHGGHCVIIPRGIFKGPIGSAYLPLGELKQLSTDLKTSFTFFNKGPLKGFAAVQVESIGLELPRLRNCVEVEPQISLIEAECSATVTVTFSPRREDIKKIFRKLVNKNMDVITLANLRVITGENATRIQIHNLIQQMNENEKSNFVGTSLSRLWEPFPDDEPYTPLEVLREKVGSAFDLLSTFRTHDIAITLNHSILDDTVQDTLLFSENDETILFRTIVSDASFCNSTNEESDVLEARRNSVESYSVRPSKLEIDLADPSRAKAVFTIRSNFFIKKTFRVDSNVRHVIQFSPMHGSIMPSEVVEVNVQTKLGFLPIEPVQIWVCLDDLKITLPVVMKNGNVSTDVA